MVRASPMVADPITITLAAADVAAFRSAVIACAAPSEQKQCERLLGQLASLEAHAAGQRLRFIPPRDARALARRAAAHLAGRAAG